MTRKTGPAIRTRSLNSRLQQSCQAAWAVIAVAMIVAVLWACTFGPPVTAQAAVPQRMFWIADNGIYKRVACEQVAVGTHATVFNCGQPALAPHDAEVLIRAFDQRIFPTDVRDFGAPHGMQTVTILLAPFSGMTFGYFDSHDLLPPATAAHSNHGNILYVRSLASMPDSNRMADVQEALAHELQHLIDYRIRVIDRDLAPQEVWLNEGLSFYAQLANGFWTPRDMLRLEAAAFDPGWPLTSMTESPQFLRQYGRVSYGRAGMFVAYLAAQYGTRFTRDIVRARQTGMRGIDAVLRREHHATCADAFAHWSVAQLLNDSGIYGYRGVLGDRFVPARSTYPTVTTYPFTSPATGHDAIVLQPWTQGYMRFSAASGLPISIRVTAPPSVRLAAVFGAAGTSGRSAVTWLKTGANQSVSLHIGSFAPSRSTVTIAMSASGSLRPGVTDVRSVVVTFHAESVYSRHDKRMPGTAAAAGANADIVF